ncbi:MAG: N-acetylmuramoyl-L-alanine amidase [Bacteroidetes bacterium]|nr:N-acetylmuramoyl-L-alanine amidase [Bacteroidota bacterium]
MHIRFFGPLVFLSLLCFFSSRALAQSQTPFVVVLDAGHGGKDPGNLGNGYKEKDIALNIVLEVGATLEKIPNVKVIYTRKTDDFVELIDRANIANKAKADLFVSVHCNAHSSQAQGTETFVLGIAQSKENFEVAKKENSVIFLEDNYEVNYEGFDPNAPETVIGLTLVQEEYLDQSILLASKIQDQFTNSFKRVNRGVKQANLLVNRLTFMPSVLVEVGFLTNRAEGAYLHSTRGQSDMSEAISKSIIEYRNQLLGMVGEDLSYEKSHDETPQAVAVNYEKRADLVFKVQLFASSKKLALRAKNFNNLEPVTSERTGKLYRYLYGETTDYIQTEQLLRNAKKAGYKDAYLVAYFQNNRITLDEALQKLKQN